MILLVCLLHCTGMQINFDIFLQTKAPSKRTCILAGIGQMNATGYISILEVGLKPFIRDVIPDVKFKHDNDPNHTSKQAQRWIKKENITFFCEFSQTHKQYDV